MRADVDRRTRTGLAGRLSLPGSRGPPIWAGSLRPWRGSGVAGVPDAPPSAYDMARGLADRLGAQVEPDLPSSAYRQDGTRSSAAPAVCRSGARGRGGPLPRAADKRWSVKKVRRRSGLGHPPRPGGAARGAGILVGHIDTGYTEHPEIYPDALNLTIDRDILDGDDDALDPLIKRRWFPLDNPGHGTGTSCVIGSRRPARWSGRRRRRCWCRSGRSSAWCRCWTGTSPGPSTTPGRWAAG